jgi:hypothetical protein
MGSPVIALSIHFTLFGNKTFYQLGPSVTGGDPEWGMAMKILFIGIKARIY